MTTRSHVLRIPIAAPWVPARHPGSSRLLRSDAPRLASSLLLIVLSASLTVACSSSRGFEQVGAGAAALSSESGALAGLAGKCLDANGGSSANGTVVQLWDCNGTVAQQWTLSGGQLRGPGGKCLDATGDSSTSGTRLQLWDCWGGDNQQWALTASGEIVGIGGKCVDVRSADDTNGTPVELWDCWGGANQRWAWSGASASPLPSDPPGSGSIPPAGAENAPPPTGPTLAIAPGADIQGALDGASAGVTVVFAPGVYPITQAIELRSGISLYGEPGAELEADYSSGVGLHASGISSVTVSGFLFDGGKSGGGGALGGFILVEGDSNEVHVAWNSFHNNSNQADLMAYNSDGIYFQNNRSGPNELQPVSIHHTDGVDHANAFITDNVMANYSRMAIEIQFAFKGEYHVDRNTITNPSDNVAISLAVDNTGSNAVEHGTVWGNSVTGGAAVVGIELADQNMSVEQNELVVGTGFFVGTEAGSEIENNTINSANPFQEDGGYDRTEWIGVNAVNGSGQAGWPEHGPYGAQPPVTPPSPTP